MEQEINRYAQLARNQKVTVFLLSYNRAEYLKLAIQGVLRQTYREYQLVIMDNFSTDNTLEVVGEFKDSRIHLIQRDSQGEITSYCYAFQVCVTQYLIVLHDDDIVEPDYLEEVLKAMDSKKYATVSVRSSLIDENGDYIRRAIDDAADAVYSGEEYFKKFWSRKSLSVVFPSAVYDKSFYKDMNLFFNKAAGPARDQYVWFQTERLGGAMCIVGKPLIRYRIHKNQDSAQHGGFMDLQLLDELLRDTYFLKIIEAIRKDIQYRIWVCYKTITKKYYFGSLPKEQYAAFFDFKAIGFLKKSFCGKLYYLAMLLFYKCPPVGKLAVNIYYKLHKK